MEFLQNDLIKVGINEHGAELRSLARLSDGREYMWSGDAAYWGRVSPVLFPFVGMLADKTYRYKGKEYTGVPQHGYARDRDFTLVDKSEDTIWFELVADTEWKERYPFDFCLRIGYRLEGAAVHVMWSVRNDSKEVMPFHIGAHPAFRTKDFESKVGYTIDLHVNEDALLTDLIGDGGVVTGEKVPVTLSNGKLVITEALFDGDALIFTDKVNTATLIDAQGNPFIEMRFDTPQLGIWSPVGKKAPFICIEPWYGRCDKAGFSGDLADREFTNLVEAGHTWNREYVIEVK